MYRNRSNKRQMKLCKADMKIEEENENAITGK